MINGAIKWIINRIYKWGVIIKEREYAQQSNPMYEIEPEVWPKSLPNGELTF